jgi:hypothetical protein
LAESGNYGRAIDSVLPEVGVTPAMMVWAHIIRDDGNDAAYEGPNSEDEATGLEAYMKLFLTYAFTLPGMVWRAGVKLIPRRPQRKT